MRVRSLLFFCFCLVFVSTAFSQKFTPTRFTFSGYSGATDAELLAASGLRPGTAIGQTEMDAAAAQLSKTGLFSDIRFSFSGSELHFVLKPADGLSPVFFENFPWWDAKTLTALLEQKTPLFHGRLIPQSGMQDDVVSALTALVAEKGVQPTIVSTPRLNLGTGETVGTTFRIDSPPVQVAEVKFAGLAPEWTTPIGAIQQAAVGEPFNDTVQETLAAAVKVAYHREGFLEVAITGFRHGDPVVTAGKVAVPIDAVVEQGSQYRLASLQLSGDVLMTPAEFAKVARLQPGDVVNEDKLRQTMAFVASPYRAKGYLRARMQTAPTFDRTQHTVSYVITVVPGDVFHMGKLSIANLDEEKKQLFLKYWDLHEGDVYDATYTPSFLVKNVKTLYKLDGLSAGYKQFEHEDTHVVDLVVTFQKGGPLQQFASPVP